MYYKFKLKNKYNEKKDYIYVLFCLVVIMGGSYLVYELESNNRTRKMRLKQLGQEILELHIKSDSINNAIRKELSSNWINTTSVRYEEMSQELNSIIHKNDSLRKERDNVFYSGIK